MGSVALAEDLLDGTHVALKRVRAQNSADGTIAVLRNEFLVLATLRHPGLARVYDFGKDLATGDYFFTSEFVDVLAFSSCAGGRFWYVGFDDVLV